MANSDDERIGYLAGDGGLSPSLPAPDREALDDLRALLSSPSTWEEPDPSLEQRIVTAIAEEAPARRSRRSSRRRASGGMPALLRPAYGLAAVAAAVVALAVVLIAGGGSGSPRPLQFAMVVSGTALAPAAHGSATLTKTASGWRIELRASGLPRREKGLYYEAWVKNAAGVLVPVGTFNDGRSVTLWSGVPVTEYRTLTVTRQHSGAGPASSGERVLEGTITTRGRP